MDHEKAIIRTTQQHGSSIERPTATAGQGPGCVIKHFC